MSDDNLSIMSSGTTLMIDDEIQDETLKSFLQCNCKTCLEMYHNSTLSDNQSTHSKATLKSIQHQHQHHLDNEALHHHHDHEEYHLDDFSSHHFSHSYCHSHHHHNSKNVVVDDKSDVLSNLDALTVMSVHTTRSHPLFPSNIYDDCLSQVVGEDEDEDDEGRRSFHKLTNYKFNNNNFMDDLEFNDDEKPSINSKSIIMKEGNEFDSEKKLDEALETTMEFDEEELMNVSDDKEAIEKETELIIDDNMLEDDEEDPALQEETNLEFDDWKSECKEEAKCNELEFEDDEQVINKKEDIETLEFNEVETHLNDDNISTITGVETIEIRNQQEIDPHTELEFENEQICSELDIDDVEAVLKDDCKPIEGEQFNEINESDLKEEEQSNVKSPIVDFESEMECAEPENQTIIEAGLIEEEKVVDKMEDDLEFNHFSPELIEPIKECEDELITMDNILIEENIQVIVGSIKGFLDRRTFNKCKQLANNIQAVSRQISNNREKYIQTIGFVKTLIQSSIVRKNLNRLKKSTETITSIGKGISVRFDLKMSFERVETIQGLMRGVIYRKCQQNEKNNQMITDDFCHSPNTMFDNIPSPPMIKTEPKVKECNFIEEEKVSFFPHPLPKPFRLGKQEKIKKPKKEEPKIEKKVEVYNPKPIQNYGKISMIRHEIKRKNDEFYFDQAVEDTRVNEIEDENQMNEEQEEEEPIVIVQPKKKMKMTKPSTHSTIPIFKRLDLTDEEIDELIIQKEKLCKIENDLAKLKEKEE